MANNREVYLKRTVCKSENFTDDLTNLINSEESKSTDTVKIRYLSHSVLYLQDLFHIGVTFSKEYL